MRGRWTVRTLIALTFTATALVAFTSTTGAVPGDKKIRMYDDCDPATFNAVLGAGACVGNGHTTFDEFIGELTETQDAHAWRNQPVDMRLNVGRGTIIENLGGEVHTFTPVANFGGGFVNLLNGISGNPVPAPECLNFGAIVFIPAGAVEEGPTAGSAGLPVGSHKFQCCIHPWMRTVIEVSSTGGQAAAAPVSATDDSGSHHGHH